MNRKHKIQNIIVTTTVFITGAATMILELVGSRIIAPYFGNSIFIWTSLIGIVLGSLSIGYLIGGIIADKKISFKLLSIILLINSVICFGIYFLATDILQFIFLQLKNIKLAILVSSITLFAIPSIIFGLLPPYIAKIKITSLNSSGKTVGNLYAISTIGSIIGTFLTGYYLLSVMGSLQIVLLLSIILLINSILIDYKFLLILKISFLTILIGLFISNQVKANLPDNFNVIAIVNSLYSNYYIVERNDKTKGIIRLLKTNIRGSQSGFITNDQNALLFDYTKYFTFPACYGENKNVLMLGGGGFSYAKYFLNNFTSSKLDIVEIDPTLTDIAETYFDLPLNRPNIQIINTDGRTYLNNNKELYNAMLIDAYDSFSTPFHLITKESLLEMNRSLSPNGVIVANIVSPIENNTVNVLKANYYTFSSVFPHVELYKVSSAAKLDIYQNIILIAYKNQKQQLLDTCLFTDAKLYKNKFTIQEEKNPLILTDDFAPVEFL